MEPDFTGWATKANLKCTDGRTITPDAFKHQNKMTVPLVWQHGHQSSDNVLGHAILEHVEGEGIYCQGFFNGTPRGRDAHELVAHKDIQFLSIYANGLVEKNKTVLHGDIREVSLVLAGANPEARIDFVRVAHSDNPADDEILADEAVLYTGLELEHAATSKSSSSSSSDANDPTLQEIFDSMTPEQQDVVHYLVGAAIEGAAASHSDESDATLSHQELFDKFSEPQKKLVDELVAAARKEAEEAASHSQEGNEMGDRNVFDGSGTKTDDRPVLTHDQIKEVFTDAERLGSLKESFLAHAGDYGIDNIDLLFPDATMDGNGITLLSRRMEWVNVVLQGVRHSPFSRVKSISADLTAEEARAKGYVKGSLKKNEVINLLRRVTTPQTIYKKQKLDRDDILDVTTIDIVAWLKAEMRVMLDEELARAVLVGDNREADDDDKINESNIRPIAYDVDMYNSRVQLPADAAGDDLVDAIVAEMWRYKGSGDKTMFTTTKVHTGLLLSKDQVGRRLYATDQELAAALRVNRIVDVEAMEQDSDIVAIVVDLSDYTIGTDAGGQVSMFDNFDIDYNQQKYLIEARCSGALTRPKSSITFVQPSGRTVTPTAPTFVAATGVLTVPAETGVSYQDADTGATLAAGAQPAIAPGATVEVNAIPVAGYGFTHDTEASWAFTRDA